MKILLYPSKEVEAFMQNAPQEIIISPNYYIDKDKTKDAINFAYNKTLEEMKKVSLYKNMDFQSVESDIKKFLKKRIVIK